MTDRTESGGAIAEWRGIVGLVNAAVEAAGGDLDRRATPDMSLRTLVHHVVEANVVAASMVVAAVGSPGCTYDWSWMIPFGPWLERTRYDAKPIEPSLRLLAALNEWVAAQLEPLPAALDSAIFLRDQPDAELRRVTVADVLRQEIDHAREHFGQHR